MVLILLHCPEETLALKATVRVLWLAALAAAVLSAAEADARRGAEFFATQGCKDCHTGGRAPDLTRVLDRDYTPAGITARMWNHAPAMWSAMGKDRRAAPEVTQQNAGDLFAFLYSARYFEKAGDAGRGRRAFTTKRCADCHALAGQKPGAGPAVAQWRAISDPISLVDHMWNHAPEMKAALAQKNLKWPEMTAQDLTDMLVYLRNLPEMKGAKPDFLLPPEEDGEKLFVDKGCAECHKGTMALNLADRTLTDIAAALWSHAPKMKQPASSITYEEMRHILGALWAKQFFNPGGDPGRGKRVFEAKRCVSCHNKPPLVGDLPAMVSALWKHGPTMLANMEKKSIEWPLLTAPEVSNLVAYLSKK